MSQPQTIDSLNILKTTTNHAPIQELDPTSLNAPGGTSMKVSAPTSETEVVDPAKFQQRKHEITGQNNGEPEFIADPKTLKGGKTPDDSQFLPDTGMTALEHLNGIGREHFTDVISRYIYFDNAATTPKPARVIETISNFYNTVFASPNRGNYSLGFKSTTAFEHARQNIRDYLAGGKGEIIWSSSATDALNTLAFAFEDMVNPGDEIIVTELEHHSNLMAWQRLANRKNAKLKWLEIDEMGQLKYAQLDELITKRTKVVAFSAFSNVIGEPVDVKQFTSRLRDTEAVTVLDAVQLTPNHQVNFDELEVDYAIVSAHKMLGPTGVGAMWVKDVNKVPPLKVGGGTVSEVTRDGFVLLDAPERFDAGTQSIAGIVGFSTAIDIYRKVGIANIEDYVSRLTQYLVRKLEALDFVEIIGDPRKKSSLVAFNIKGLHPHDVVQMLDAKNIAIRAGHHCAKPLHKSLNLTASNRASLMFYNTGAEVDAFVEELENIRSFFKL
jgi:cysteine desulfurase/selenocysteine lyase